MIFTRFTSAKCFPPEEVGFGLVFDDKAFRASANSEGVIGEFLVVLSMVCNVCKFGYQNAVFHRYYSCGFVHNQPATQLAS